MTSTSFEAPTATSSGLLSITTPFVQPSECASYWYLTSGSINSYNLPPTISVLVSDPADKRFASCQPSGWDRVTSESRFSFSPGVCPSDWVYIDMAEGVSTTSDTLQATFSTAYCCASGFDLWPVTEFPVTSMTKPCYRQIKDGDTSIMGTLSHGEGSTRVFTGGFQAHEAWQISWEAADRSTLTPSLPDLTSNKQVPTWTAGETIPTGKYDPETGEGNDMPGSGRVIQFAMIGVPIIWVAIIALIVWLIIRHKRTTNRRALQTSSEFNNTRKDSRADS